MKTDIEKRLFESISREYNGLNELCAKIQKSYEKDEPVELEHQDIIPLLNVLDTFDGISLYDLENCEEEKGE